MKKAVNTYKSRFIALKISVLLLVVVGIWVAITYHLITSSQIDCIIFGKYDFLWIIIGIVLSISFYLSLLNYIKEVNITEKSLRNHKKELQLIFDSVPAMIWYKDKNNKYLRVNLEAAKISGLSPEKISGQSATDIFPGLGEQLFFEDQNVIQTGKPLKGRVTKLPTAYGGFIHVQTDKIPYYDENGNITGVIVFGVDVSEKLKKDEEIKQKNLVLETILDTIPAHVFLKDKNLAYIKANKQVNNFFGIEPDELIGKTDYDILPKEQAEENVRIDKQIFENQKPIYNDIQKLTTPDGKYIWTTRYRSPFRNEDGEIIGLVGISVNVTEQMDLEEKLVKKIIEQESLLDTISAFVYYKDIDFKYIAVNKSFSELLGHDIQSIVGKTDFEICDIEMAEHYNKMDMEVVKTGKPIINLIEKDFSKNPQNKWLSINKYPYRDVNGQITGIVGITFDITDQIKTENELKNIIEENKKLLDDVVEYDKIKTAFFANISHEFKTPLNVILSTLQLISSYQKECAAIKCNPKMGRYTEIMRQNCYRLLRLINNLIDVTRIESGFISLNIHNYNFVNIVEETTLSISEYAQNHKINLEFDTEVEEKIIACDSDKIERVLLNLLSNAVKFSKPDGNIWVKIKDENNKILVSIRDTGIGIPEDKLETIFNRFSQLNQTLTRDHEGSGIGLFLVKSLIEMHNGEIHVKSEVGSGTEFIIELPVCVVDEANFDYGVLTYQELASSAGIEFSDIY